MIVVPAAAAPVSSARRVQGVFIVIPPDPASASPLGRPDGFRRRSLNPSYGPPNSLRTGKITGNSCDLRPFRRFPPGSGVHLRCNSGALQTIPCSAPNREIVLRKQGIHLSEAGTTRT